MYANGKKSAESSSATWMLSYFLLVIPTSLFSTLIETVYFLCNLMGILATQVAIPENFEFT